MPVRKDCLLGVAPTRGDLRPSPGALVCFVFEDLFAKKPQSLPLSALPLSTPQPRAAQHEKAAGSRNRACQAQSAEGKAINVVVMGSSPTVGVFGFAAPRGKHPARHGMRLVYCFYKQVDLQGSKAARYQGSKVPRNETYRVLRSSCLPRTALVTLYRIPRSTWYTEYHVRRPRGIATAEHLGI